MITFWDLLAVAVIAGFAFWGWLAGLLRASVAALELMACLAIAVVLHEALAGFLHAGLVLVVGDWVGQSWSVLAAFAALAWGLFALLRIVLHGRPADGSEDEDEEAEIDPLGDRLAGAVAGALGGALFGGGVLVTLSMVPWLAGLKPGNDRMLLDLGKLVLRAGGQFAGERIEGRELPLWGEPPSRMSVPAARLTGEPWYDVDDDGKFTEADRFRDVDGNGTFTKDLYFIDVDQDGLRRIGLVDKYVVGRWDGGLISEDRPRPAPPKPVAAPVSPAPRKPPSDPAAPKATAPGEPAEPGKPAEPPEPESPERPGERRPGDDF